MADAVGKVADEVDKVAEEFAEKLPEGGMLKGIVKSIEHLAEETENDAQLVEDLMDKVFIYCFFFLFDFNFHQLKLAILFPKNIVWTSCVFYC